MERVVKKVGSMAVGGPRDGQTPLGMKASGYGRFGGKAEIDAITELLWITIETEPGHYPMRSAR